MLPSCIHKTLNERGAHASRDFHWVAEQAVSELRFPPRILTAAASRAVDRAGAGDCLNSSVLLDAIHIAADCSAPRRSFAINEMRPASGPTHPLVALVREGKKRQAHNALRVAMRVYGTPFDELVTETFEWYLDRVRRWLNDDLSEPSGIHAVHAFALPPVLGLNQGQLEEHLSIMLFDRGEQENFREEPRLLSMIEAYVMSLPGPRQCLHDLQSTQDGSKRLLDELSAEPGFCRRCAYAAIGSACRIAEGSR